MKTRFFIVALFFVGVTFLKAEETITIQANSYDISENLDLRAVADLFGRSESVEEFEINLNNSESQYSNLDLNEDGFVDYLRVVEERKNDTHFVILQAVLARDVYQDVATIVVEKKGNKVYTQVIGDPFIYGVDYIIEPVYAYIPSFYSYFWVRNYRLWYSPYYWGYYSPFYRHHHCWLVADYHRHMHLYHKEHHFSYKYGVKPISSYSSGKRESSRRDYAVANPQKSFSQRQSSTEVLNKRQLQQKNTSSRSSSTRVQSSRSVAPARSSSSQAVTSSRSSSTRTQAVSPARSSSSSVGATSSSRSTSSRTQVSVPARSSSSSSVSRSSSTSSSRSSSVSSSRSSSSSSSSSGFSGTSRSSSSSSSRSSSSRSGR
ncbi:MAG: hypothetical protein J6U44_06640 [Paludibacteraceae bacterium]|nr:hypothetical protein [Paludibacteraceae bacterium]MBO7316818.1 hypothetical protein [Paludibacteraceae bacterium]